MYMYLYCYGVNQNNFTTSAGIRTVITKWGEKRAMLLQILNVGYGVGALFVPILVNPFLAILKQRKNKHKPKGDNVVVKQDSHLHTAFVIIGILTLALSFLFFYFHIKKVLSKSGHSVAYTPLQPVSHRKQRHSPCCDAINPATYANGQSVYGSIIFVLLFIYFFNIGGGAEMFAHFVRSISVKVFKFTNNEASYLNTSFWIGITLGRIVTSFTACYVSTRKLFRIHVFLHAVATTMVNLSASSSPQMLWVGTFVEGCLISPLYAGGIAYVSTLVEVSGVCLMVIQLASSAGDLVYIWVAGMLYDQFGPQAVLYGVQLVGIILLLTGFMFRMLERYKKETSVENAVTS